uniref:Reductase n=1 Tax=Micromonospora griseorubida TaxID=28040 RepID=Q83WE4_MICGR|nr:reductase [Micromonospora griseorubida]
MGPRTSALSSSITTCTRPHADLTAATDDLRHRLTAVVGLTEPDAATVAAPLVRLAVIFGNRPFTLLEQARDELRVDRPAFRRLLDIFSQVPELRTAVESGPAGKYWRNTVLPLERRCAVEAALRHEPVFPRIVGLYPGLTCMFRCHFCVRVTGARYEASLLDSGTALLASVIDELPRDNPDATYLSGGLEPLTNPKVGTLASRAAARGQRVTIYTNAFALTDQTLRHQPGLWDLHAVRVSLYGLDDEEYEATTGKRKAFERVRANLRHFQKLRAERGSPVRLGMTYLVLPGRAARLLDLVDFIADLNEAAPDRPIDFLNVREDYSSRPDGALSPDERAELRDSLGRFEARALDRAPTLSIDFGYALESMRMGMDAEMIRIRPETMRPSAHPQIAVQVDLRGDVYLYREAGFPDLAGADRYIAGRIGPDTSLAEVVRNFVASGRRIAAQPGDEYFMDGFDQAVTARLNQLTTDRADGWGDARGFLR